MARACLHVLDNLEAEDLYNQNISHINIGSGEEVSINDLAFLIAKTVDYKGDVKFDLSKPDGTLRKWMDSSKLNSLGFYCKIKLEEGIKNTYNWYLQNQDKIKI